MARRLSLVCSLVLCHLALAACTQVLGLERARLEADAGTAGSGGPGSGPVSAPMRRQACEEEPLSDCRTCLQGCGGVIEECMSDDGCRNELDAYAFCLGAQCNRDQEECIFGFRPGVDDCVSGCADRCAGTSLVTPCELYCACMADACTSEGLEDCMGTCMTLPAEVIACRYSHCDFAADQTGEERTRHCRHASDNLHVCDSYADVPNDDRSFCLDKQESMWACNHPSECCSGMCLSGECK